MNRLLGLDVGERRIGVAVADDDGRAVPLLTLRRSADPSTDAEALARLVAEHEVADVVVGLPLDVSGGEGRQARLTRDWVDAVASLVPARFVFRDERLSSHLAEQRIGPMKRGRSGGPPSRTQRDQWRARVDREAAAILLQDELDARAAPPSPPTATTTMAEGPR
jgi:putative Holliday junction resolvase